MNVAEMIAVSGWSSVSGNSELGFFNLRWPTNIFQIDEPGTHPRLIQVLWPFAAEESRQLPSEDDQAAMRLFENRLCEAWETDALAVLTAVLLLDGAKQWVFYTSDISQCEQRLNDMPQMEEPYPIELTTRLDPEWSYVHDLISPHVESDAG